MAKLKEFSGLIRYEIDDGKIKDFSGKVLYLLQNDKI
jgi:hypothetical protein